MTALTHRSTMQPLLNAVAADLTAYLAYVGVVASAIFFAVMAFAFSAESALTWVDSVSRPAAKAGETRPEPASPAEYILEARASGFAMLPASMPARMKDDVLASQF